MENRANNIRKFWGLEVDLCRIAGSLGLKKKELLSNPSRLPWDVRQTVERLLWDQVYYLDLVASDSAHHLRLVSD